MLLAIPRLDGGWSLHAAGERHTPVLDRGLLELISSHQGALELEDLLVARPDSPLAAFPHSMRWVYGLAIRDESARTVAVLTVMDRWLRSLAGRDRRVMQLVARQVGSRLGSQVPVAPADPPAPGPLPAAPAPNGSAGVVPALRQDRSARVGMQTKLLRSSEVAALFDVTERTVINWAAAGKIPSIRTVGGHLRFRQEDIMELVSGQG